MWHELGVVFLITGAIAATVWWAKPHHIIIGLLTAGTILVVFA